ncbi:5-formyltetrahydrofolate cyclo-ligase [Campylobacter fetus]|uniref:5-formyltetrahydrofolate cyclo-ligase n=1 Tax=Campylobacter fetus subsp. testudinum TaxID=1507806 RepID=A0AAX0H935_CAMFE|nr:5-formyltetrahydrofolate cyclo-ligase [Campylobacter fetus]AGZ81391.1 5,10-methenyltetrahydrofolate synthetase [Campylobacter fetus subsp. testudinum 03-427]AJB45139.1 5,10-methenyltetrahydrofolate synthetase [Campylobacter fetus subsp. testudinum]ALV64490.1 5,10-methenyltetrahydrofolate synthetase [Campylobacter fetus subsp. testudinum Sp3]AVK80814.1 5-formyltetrahydrofolate cyclo-ligase [Campylobacter fetus subsp. testudinum]EAI4322825.1 5-formyltetrahydrofolate cyclo-ligase [Campylobacte
MVVKFEKSSYRKFAKEKLRKIIKFRAKSFSYKINNEILNLIKYLKARNVLIFTPLAYEPDLLKLRQKLSRNHNIFIPFMVDKSLKMVKLRLPFKTSKFNVKEASDSNAFFKSIDLAVIPVVGVDGNMARIGHGMGYYDRFFAKLAYKPITVFVQIEDFYIKEKICSLHDITCDFYITPTKKYIKKVSYDRSCSRDRRWAYRDRRWISCS